MYFGPLAFKEVFKAKPWGGRGLARFAGKRLPPGVPIGESWEVSDHPHGMSLVSDGPVAGKSLADLMADHARSIVGRKPRNGRFPLLIKTIHARRVLSAQVHPDDRLAAAMKLDDPGKTEAWYFLHASPGAYVVAGLKSKRDIARLEELARTGRIAERLKMRPVRTGEALLCRAGVIHGNGPNAVLLEVQQNSDATFRLHDWGRVGLDGKPRELHIAEAVRAVGNEAGTVERQRPRVLRGLGFRAERLVACEKFVLDRWRIRGAVERGKPKRFEILYTVGGSGRLSDGRWPEQALKKGRTVLIPACVGAYSMRASRPLTIIRMAEPE